MFWQLSYLKGVWVYVCYDYIGSIVMNADNFCSQVCKNVLISGKEKKSLTENNSKKPLSKKMYSLQLDSPTSEHLQHHVREFRGGEIKLPSGSTPNMFPFTELL